MRDLEYYRNLRRPAADVNGFKTPEQAEFDHLVKAAKRVLRDHRVEVVSRAKVPDGHLIAIADLLEEIDLPASTAAEEE